MTAPTPSPPARSRRWRARGLLALSLATTVTVAADLDWAGRPFLSVAFFLLVPGIAVVGFVGLDDALAEVTVGAALSIALSTAVAMVMLWLRAWDPAIAQELMALLSAPLLVATAWPGHRLTAWAGGPERWEVPQRAAGATDGAAGK